MKRHEYQRIVSSAESMIEKFKSGKIKKYRVVTKVWKHVLLSGLDEFMIKADQVKLVGKHVGAGVYEVHLKGE